MRPTKEQESGQSTSTQAWGILSLRSVHDAWQLLPRDVRDGDGEFGYGAVRAERGGRGARGAGKEG